MTARPRLSTVPQPAARTGKPDVRTVRLRHVSLRGAAIGGAVAGFAGGLFAGSLLGALLSWLAGAALEWQAHLAFQLGVTEDLLPLGQQVGLLQAMQADWWLVVPAAGLALALPAALAGGLGLALLAALFNRIGPALEMTVEDVRGPEAGDRFEPQ
jgi:hypothetical protein